MLIARTVGVSQLLESKSVKADCPNIETTTHNSLHLLKQTTQMRKKLPQLEKFKILLISFLLLICFPLFGQQLDLEQLKGLKIRNIGPAGMSGRVTAIAVVHNQPDIIFIGTASGGVWKSDSGGIRWEPVFDDAPLQSIGAIAINQNNPSEIWVGTGEGNPRNSHNSGKGIYKSIDGGKTWKSAGLENTRLIHRIIIHKDNPDIIFAGALGSAWGPNEERGVFKTTNGGESWKKILYINNETGIADLITDPTNPNKLIAATWEFGRKPWTFNSGGKGSGLHISYDSGETWKQITSEEGLPKGTLGRIGLAIAPSKPNIIYALVEAKKNGLYKSVDGGHKWSLVSEKNIGNRPFYYAELYVDPKNENRIWNLYSYVSKSEDGGKTFKTILDYGKGVHPDHHAFWIHPDDPDYLIDGNDGGLNISRDGGKNWRFVENLPLAQFYHIDYDMDIPYNVCGGMQDNGSWVGPSAVWKSGGIRNSDWQEVMFGDGFDVLMRRDNNRYGFAMSQGGNLAYFDRTTGRSQFIKPNHPDGKALRFNWNAALAQNPFHDCGIYYGSQNLHKSLDCGQTWEIISPDLTTNDTTKQKESRNSGGLTFDVTNAENFTSIVSIAPSQVDQNVIWVGTDDGNLQLTKDGGKTWENVAARLTGCPTGSWIPQIQVSHKNAGEAFVVVNNYRRNDWTPYLYHTTNFGQAWRRLADQSNVEGYALCMVQDPVEPNLLFLGTDYGLYVSINGGTNWTKWMNDYPSVPTRDLKIHSRDHDLIVGTFGRAAWILDDIRPLREIAKTNGDILKTDFATFPAPDAYMVNYRSVDGVRFTADAAYRGANKGSAAMITYWAKPEKKDKKEVDKKEQKKKETDKKPDAKTLKDKDKKSGKGKKIKVQVVDSKGDTIRTFTTKVKTGMNRLYWNLDKDGVRGPSRRDPKPDDDLPGGVKVLPGTYNIVLSYGKDTVSTAVHVKADPRLGISINQMKAKQTALEDYAKWVEKAAKGFSQLKEAKKTIKLVNDQMVNAPDSTKKEIADAGKAVQDSITRLMNLYFLPEDSKGIQDSSDKLSSFLWRARGFINASDGAPNQNAQHAVDKAKSEIQKVLDQINTFIANDWKTYQQKVETVKYSLFKEFEKIE